MSVTLSPVAVVSLLLVRVTVKPICDPELTLAASAVLVMLTSGGTVGVGVKVAVAVGVGVKVAVAVAVAVAVGVGVASGPLVSGKTKAPRPRVHTESVVAPRSMDMSQIMTWGMPASKRYQTGDATVTSSV